MYNQEIQKSEYTKARQTRNKQKGPKTKRTEAVMEQTAKKRKEVPNQRNRSCDVKNSLTNGRKSQTK